MANFGLDNSFVKKLKKELDTNQIRTDQSTDFFFLPQLDAIYRYQGDELKDLVCSKLSGSSFGPKLPIEMEVPKTARVPTKNSSLVGPNYFRPGSVLLPEDRVLYHFIGQEAAECSEKSIDRKKVYSNVPASVKGSGFVAASLQWKKLRAEFKQFADSGKFKFVLKSDITQYFFSINQHELVNQLEHQGFPPELVKMSEKFLTGLTLDRSSRGIPQGCYGSDVIGNGFLVAIDEFIAENKLTFLRYVDDIYVFFTNSDEIRDFFPEFVKKLRDYDLSLNERKTFFTTPSKLLREETELDEAIEKAKAEAKEKLTDYHEIEVDGEYDNESYIEILEMEPDDKEVALEATLEVFKSLDNFTGDERDRAEAFCLSFFRRAGDPVAIPYVIRRWSRSPDKARDYALYLNRFIGDVKHRVIIDKLFASSSQEMIDYQWAWASVVMRRMSKMSDDFLKIADEIRKDGARHEVIRSLLTYSVCRHGTALRKKNVRDSYSAAPLLVQLAILHSSSFFTAAERNALLKSAESHGDIHKLMCAAVKADIKENLKS